MKAALAAVSPVHDRAGNISVLRLLVFALCAAPAIWMAYKWHSGLLSPKPVTDIIRESGSWAMRFIVLALAVSPLRAASRWNALIGVRRMIGLAALFYVGVHLAFYFWEQKWIWTTIAREIVLRTYLTIGFAAVVMLLALGATSHDAMVRKLGAARWNRLHMLIYAAALLAIIHYFMQVRLKAWQPSLIAGLLVFLALVRVWRKWRGEAGVGMLAVFAALAGLATALIEASFYRFGMNAPFMRVFESNLNFEWEIRPAWYALGICLCFALVRLAQTVASRWTAQPLSSRKTQTAPHR